MLYLREVAQMCVFSPSMWKGANKTLGSARESSRQKRCYSPCSLSPDKSPFSLFIKSFWAASLMQVGSPLGGSAGNGALARRLLPKPKCNRAQRTRKTFGVTAVGEKFTHPGAAPLSIDIYCLCFSTKSSSTFNSITGSTDAKAYWRTREDLLFKHLSGSHRSGDMQLHMQNHSHLCW